MEMTLPPYPLPEGVEPIPPSQLDPRSDEDVDRALLDPAGPTADSEKNVWFYWHAGYARMYPYAQRNVRAYFRRLAPRGWTVRVVDRVPGSRLNIDRFLDPNDPAAFPRAFADGTLDGPYALQHASDLVRFPLLLKYGGIYADVGFMQIGDLDRLWSETVASEASPYDVIGYLDPNDTPQLYNYFVGAGRGNPLIARCHEVLLALWAEGGGRTSTEGMHASPLLAEVPLMGSDSMTLEEDGRVYRGEEVKRMLSDYIVQGMAIMKVMGLVDVEGGWDGPHYVAERVYAIDFMEGSQLINGLTAWDGPRQFELLSLRLPADGKDESADQREARRIVEECLRKSFGFKLAHGLIFKVMGHTLGTLWRAHEGSDDVPGTYAHWLRFGIANWTQARLPPRVECSAAGPLKRGRLLCH